MRCQVLHTLDGANAMVLVAARESSLVLGLGLLAADVKLLLDLVHFDRFRFGM